MTAPKARAGEDRIQRLRQHIAQTQAQLRRERRKQQARERAARSQRLLPYGELVALAALDQEDPTVVLGLLLEGAPRIQDLSTRHRWHVAGVHCLRGTSRELGSLSSHTCRGSTSSAAVTPERPQRDLDAGLQPRPASSSCVLLPTPTNDTHGDLLHSPEHPGIVSGEM